MKRIKAVTRVKAEEPTRVKPTIPAQSPKGPQNTQSHQRIKQVSNCDSDIIHSGRLYDGGMVKDQQTGMFWKKGEYYKKIDGCYFKCWPDGTIKDQKTDTHVCWFGKITKRATPEHLKAVSITIQKAMLKSMPHLFFDDDGHRIQRVDCDGNMIHERKFVQ